MKKEPDSDATLEEQEEYQAWVDAYPKERETKIREYIQERVDKIEEELNVKKDKESLFKDFEKAITDQLCENEMMLKYRDMCAYLGSYKDSEYKEMFFKDFSEFENLPKEIKDQFLESYVSLEIGGEDLKKLLRSNAIACLWAIARDLKIPLDTKITELRDLPFTISFVIRKRMQLDGFGELPKEKRPPDYMIWDGTIEEMEKWLDEVMTGKKQVTSEIMIPDSGD